MALCERCGSINIVRVRHQPIDSLVALFTRRRPFVCRRCGWRARRSWDRAALKALMEYGGAGGEPDPALAVLDDDLASIGSRTPKRRAQASPEKFDLDTLDQDPAAPGQPDSASGQQLSRTARPPVARRPVRRRSKRAQRMEIVATIAAAAIVMFLIVMVSMTGSCSGNPDAL